MDLDDNPASRPASATSSLDPYYFGIQSPTESPMPPLPTSSLYPSTTPEQRSINEPVTPARDPAAIDRRGLVGVGELATPRWTRAAQDDSEDTPEPDAAADGFEVIVPEDLGDDAPDSPWTIEAIDGEGSEREEVCLFSLTSHTLHMVLIYNTSFWTSKRPHAQSVNGPLSQRRAAAKKFSTLASMKRPSQSCPNGSHQTNPNPLRAPLPHPRAEPRSGPQTSLNWIRQVLSSPNGLALPPSNMIKAKTTRQRPPRASIAVSPVEASPTHLLGNPRSAEGRASG